MIYVVEILLNKHRGNSSNYKCTLECKQISQQIMPGGKCKNHINAFQILIENKMPKAWFIHHHSISTSLSISIYLTVLFLKELHLSFCFLFCWYPSKMLDYISSMSSHLMIISKWEWKRKCAKEGRISFEKEHTLLEVLKWIKWWDKKETYLTDDAISGLDTEFSNILSLNYENPV